MRSTPFLWLGATFGAGVPLLLSSHGNAACGEPATAIHDVQGNADSSPLSGETVTLEAVVVGDTQGEAGLGGFFLQEPDGETDLDASTSEALFVFEEVPLGDVALGDVVRVTGTVEERFELSSLLARSLEVCSYPASASPVDLAFPLASAELEQWEGMAVRVRGPLVVTDTFDLARYGEVELAFESRLLQPTEVAKPGQSAHDVWARNDTLRIQLDDGSGLSYPIPPPYLGSDGTLRAGDEVGSVEGVLGFAYGRFELHPSAHVEFSRENPRTSLPPDVGGALRIASFNLANYFTTIDAGDPLCGPQHDIECRGAQSEAARTLQRAKLLATLDGLDADVAALVELENGGDALADLVAGLNELRGTTEFAFIDTGSVGTDAIQVGLLYRSASVAPAGPYALLDSSVDARFEDHFNRPVLVQTFAAKGERFSVAVNHLKSKGSDCDAALDPDTGDGQGECNLTRLHAVQAELDWLRSDPTASGDSDVLIVGDLNAYSLEDPLSALVDAGYVDLADVLTYSYVFEGQFGALDHALASPDFALQVTGTAVWHINADEPPFLDYRGTPDGEATPFRSSDHDPLLVGVTLGSDGSADSVVLSAPSTPRPNNPVAQVDAPSAAPSSRDAAEPGQRIETGPRAVHRPRTAGGPESRGCSLWPGCPRRAGLLTQWAWMLIAVAAWFGQRSRRRWRFRALWGAGNVSQPNLARAPLRRR